MNNKNNIDYSNMDKKQIAVMKRKATILKKREMKETKRVMNQSKKVLKAGLTYSEEKANVSDKFKIKDDSKAQRERKKYERKMDTVSSAINNMFHTRTLNDLYSMNMIVQKKDSIIIQPNEAYIKNRLTNIFTNEITNNSKNLKISQFVTIKYLISDGSEEIDNNYMDKLDNRTYDKKEFREMYFNSEIEVLTSVKKLILLLIILLVNL
jgi:hypothetical protein